MISFRSFQCCPEVTKVKTLKPLLIKISIDKNVEKNHFINSLKFWINKSLETRLQGLVVHIMTFQENIPSISSVSSK